MCAIPYHTRIQFTIRYGKSGTDEVHCDMLADGIKDLLGKLTECPFQTDKEAFKAH